MKVHFHPASTASRPVILFCAEEKIAYEPVVVDILKGAHYEEPFVTLNPSKMVPVLEDGDLVLTESSAILKYVAEKAGSAAYPKDIKQRARINERMDWFNTQQYREWGYHLIYPQIFPHHKRPSDESQKSTVEWGREKSEQWLKVLDQNVIGKHGYLCGDSISIADYFGAEILSAGDLIGVSFHRFPNVDRWMNAMRALPSWKNVHETIDGFAASLKGQKFVTISA
jgi:glutathione S-transferase